ncbi:neural cell adhesion molecule 2-like [Lycorma delicatula]|uniref:neural cell adhesion molecule 2-like n=1 Tax=Lycorma delicatula TaxID=130591 RepID=UPI003F516831
MDVNFILLLVDTVTPQKFDAVIIEAVVNSVAKLPCDVSSPSSDQLSLVIWYKDGIASPIYSVDLRGRQVEAGSHWADKEVLGGRGHYTVSPPHSELILESVLESDAGSFKCRVDFRHSPTRNSVLNLTVIVPAKKLVVLDVNGSALQSTVIGPISEGTSLQLSCVAISGRPAPRVSWWRDGVLLDEADEILSENRVRNLLTLERVERRHLGSLLTCQATNSRLLPPLSTTLSIDLYLRPLEVRLIGENQIFSAGTHYEVSCLTTGSRPAPVITWWKSGQQIQTHINEIVTSDDGNVTTSTLNFIPQVEDAGARLSCRGTNPHLPASMIEDSWKLDVHYVPIVSLELGTNLNATNIREGMDVYFECKIKANPWVRRVTWLHDGREVENNSSAGVIVSNQTLVLQSVSRQGTGLYSCLASSSAGDTESKPFNLDVKYEPHCRLSQQRVYGVARLEEVTVSCGVDANPPALWFRWSFNNSAIQARSVESFEAGGGRSIANYKPVSEADYGTLLCWGRNSLGSQTVPCVFHIVPAGKPDPPYNCSSNNHSQTWLLVRCAAGFDGGLPQVFAAEVWQGKGKAGHLVTNLTSHGVPDFHLKDLEPGTSYTVSIYSSNGKGRSSDSIMLSVSTLGHTHHEHRRTSDDVFSANSRSVIYGSLIAIILVILIILGGVVFFLVRKRKRRILSRRQYSSTEELEKARSAQITATTTTTSIEDDRNPDVIPQTTDIEIMAPMVSLVTPPGNVSESTVWDNLSSTNNSGSILLALPTTSLKDYQHQSTLARMRQSLHLEGDTPPATGVKTSSSFSGNELQQWVCWSNPPLLPHQQQEVILTGQNTPVAASLPQKNAETQTPLESSV